MTRSMRGSLTTRRCGVALWMAFWCHIAAAEDAGPGADADAPAPSPASEVACDASLFQVSIALRPTLEGRNVAVLLNQRRLFEGTLAPGGNPGSPSAVIAAVSRTDAVTTVRVQVDGATTGVMTLAGLSPDTEVVALGVDLAGGAVRITQTSMERRKPGASPRWATARGDRARAREQAAVEREHDRDLALAVAEHARFAEAATAERAKLIALLANPDAGPAWAASIAVEDPVHAAARRGDVKRLAQMLVSDPRMASITDRHGHTPLDAAVEARQVKSARLLIDNGAPAEGPAGSGAPLLKAVENRDVSMVTLLLKAGALPNGPHRAAALPLVQASSNADLATMTALLDAGADPNLAEDGDTAVEEAIAASSTAAVKLLVARGARLSPLSGWRGDPLVVAARAGDKPLVRFLLEHGMVPAEPLPATAHGAASQAAQLLRREQPKEDAGDASLRGALLRYQQCMTQGGGEQSKGCGEASDALRALLRARC